MPRKPDARLGKARSRIYIDTSWPEVRRQVDEYLTRAHYRYEQSYRGRKVKPTHLVNASLIGFMEALDDDDRDRLFLRYSRRFDLRRVKQPGAADDPTRAEPHPLEPPVRP